MNATPDELALVDGVHDDLLAAGRAEPGLVVNRREVVRRIRERHPLLPGPAVHRVADGVLGRLTGVGPLAPLLDDPAVSDVLVNGCGSVWVERNGRLARTEIVLTADDRLRMLARILAPLGLRIDRSSPLVDARLPDGSRVHAAVPPLAVDGPCLAIRRFAAVTVSLAELAAPPVVELLRWAVAARQNVAVVGGTGAGKTTLLNALAGELGHDQRIVTIEDTAELRLGHPHVVRLEARPASADGVGAVSIRELVRNALRMRPDRIVVGEVRGPEALDMLQAMNTGHEGSMTTLHANSPADGLRRLETMVLLNGEVLSPAAVRDEIAASVDLLVQVARTTSGARRVVAVAEPALAPDAHGRLALHPLVRAGELVDGPHRPARRPDVPLPEVAGG